MVFGISLTKNRHLDIEIVSFNYELSRSVDSKGHPSSVTQGGVVHVELTLSDADSPLAEWLANQLLHGERWHNPLYGSEY